MTTFRLFCYGTLMSGYGLSRVLVSGRAELIGGAVTAEDTFNLTTCGYPFLIAQGPHERRQVVGELWSVPVALRRRLDEIEGAYVPTMIELQGHADPALAYVYRQAYGPKYPLCRFDHAGRYSFRHTSRDIG